METEFIPAKSEREDTLYRYSYSGFTRRTDSLRHTLQTYPVSSSYQIESTDEIDRAITECLLKLKDKKIDLGTALAESVKTVNMLADTVVPLWRALLDIKRGRFRGIRRYYPGLRTPVKTAAGTYLQYKYGWKPLMSDVYDAHSIAMGSLNDPRGKLFSAERHITGNYSSDTDVQYWSDRQQDVTLVGSCKLFASLNSKFYADAGRVGLNNPAALAWELVPFSFVIDWGMPVGNFLEGINATAGLNFEGGYTSLNMDGTCTAECTPYFKGTGVGIKKRYKRFERNTLSKFPRPVLYAKSPFSTSNVTSALALWRQLLK
jgi:hypothetical protein